MLNTELREIRMEMNQKKVELLAPAGNYDALRGALAAGADAVYLGGNAFGARAYAENFSKEEICRGVRMAHLLGKKIYLTVNTLVKEREFENLYDFLQPLYEAGLDGAIIQDMGVFSFIREYFPLLELHVSTQMTVTSVYGARLLAKEGAKRVVPARELSLKELAEMKKDGKIEVEAFVHGAMCYCYSGQCLFSSILGGRSGNRGRCAQPCRLPYGVNHGKEGYPLSMKDMCTLTILPELIEAGIDSFKIEGRMKKPEYAAGVTAIYRKYIDRFRQNPQEYRVEKEDMDFLQSLYIRTEIQEGYYHRHNGREMITIGSPSYSGSDEKLLEGIRRDYIRTGPGLAVSASAILRKNEAARMSLTLGDTTVTVSGDVVQMAKKQPLSKEKIKEQLSKSSHELFDTAFLEVEADPAVFMPVSSLNQLRRDAFFRLEQELLSAFGREGRNARPLSFAQIPKKKETEAEPGRREGAGSKNKRRGILHVLVSTREQLAEALAAGIPRIYLDKMRLTKELSAYLSAHRGECEFFLAFPWIFRRKDADRLEKMISLAEQDIFAGVLIRNVDTLSFLMEKSFKKQIVSDINLYIWNSRAFGFWSRWADEIYLPAELNFHELQEMKERTDGRGGRLSSLIYGRLPMMISANCVRKTTKDCDKEPGYSVLTDRYRKDFPVYTDCDFCYNIIYNSVPLSLHGLFAKKQTPAEVGRLDFTVESGVECANVIRYFQSLSEKYVEPFYRDFTTGHYKRGVE